MIRDNRFQAIRTILLLAVTLLGPIPQVSATCNDADPTLWTSADGVTIRARFAGWDGQRVFLVKNGRHFEVPLARLSPESVGKAKRLLGLSGEVRGREIRGSKPSGPAISEPNASRDFQVPARVATPPSVAGTSRIDRHGMPIHPYQVRTRLVRTTAYCCGESDHLIYGSLNALGTPLRYDSLRRSAAADWSVYPVGTEFRIKGLPWLYVVDDYGSALVGTGTIDLYHPGMEDMRRWGRRTVEVSIVRWGSLKQSARILAGRVNHDHCRKMLESVARQQAGLPQ